MQDRDVTDNPFDFDLWTDGTTEVKNMQDVKLKPCPFCGGEAELVCTTDNHHSPFVRCKYVSVALQNSRRSYRSVEQESRKSGSAIQGRQRKWEICLF